MLQSLRSRLVLTTLLITLLGFVAVAALFVQSLPALGRQEKERELQGQANRFAAQVTNQVYRKGGDIGSLRRELDVASLYLHERIIIANPSGTTAIFDSARRTPFYKELNGSALLQGQSVNTILPHNVVVLRSNIQGTHGHRHGGVVLLVAQAADLRTAFPLGRVSLFATGTALVVWLLIGSYMTYFVFQPLLRVTAATRRVARGDYSARVQVRGRGELGQLASGFNEMAQQVQTSDRTMRDFLANVSHDLRTPLTMIAGFSQALLDGTAGPEEVQSSAATIHEEAIKMEHLVDDLTHLTRLERGLLKLDLQPTQLRAVVQSAIDHAVRVQAGKPTADIENRVSPELPPVMVDGERLERALRNLLTNAVRYTASEGTIAVESRPAAEGWVQVAVRDTGVGIAHEDLSRIFERFYRADKSRERVEGHSGLGLAIAQEIVEAHGGKITVESTVGQGTTFRLTLPFARVSGQSVPVAPSRRRATAR